MIIRDPDRCNTDWCDAKREIAEFKAQVALLREALELCNKHGWVLEDHAHVIENALEQTK